MQLVAIIFPDFFYVTLSIGFGILFLFSLVFTKEVGKVLELLPKIDITPILNELN